MLCRRLAGGSCLARVPGPDVAYFLAEAPQQAEVTLDAEHDAHRWLPLEAAAELCLPATVAEALRRAAAALA